MKEPEPMPGQPSKPVPADPAEPTTIAATVPTANVEAKPGTAIVNGRRIGWDDQTIPKPDQP